MKKPLNKKSFVIQVLRRGSYRWPPRNEVLKNARVARGQYRCKLCDTVVGRKDITLDHIHPVVSLSGFSTWDDYIERMYCDVDGFQAICASCHDNKTALEREIRVEKRKEKKTLTSRKKRAIIRTRKKHVVKRSRNKKT